MDEYDIFHGDNLGADLNDDHAGFEEEYLNDPAGHHENTPVGFQELDQATSSLSIEIQYLNPETQSAIEALKVSFNNEIAPTENAEYFSARLGETAKAIASFQNHITELPDFESSLGSQVETHNLLSTEHDIFSDFEHIYEIHGMPDFDTALWDEQDAPNSCAVATSNMLFRSVGLNVGEDVLTDSFTEYGIYDYSSGTSLDSLNESLNSFISEQNLPLQTIEVHGFNEDTLKSMLDHGVRPLVSVDATEMYGQGIESFIYDPIESGHAIQVTGYDGENIFINDPGRPDGAGMAIPSDHFFSASSDFDNRAIAMVKI